MKTTDARLALRALAAKATLAAALTTCLSVAGWAQPSQPPTTPELNSLIGRLQALYPSTRFGEIRPTPGLPPQLTSEPSSRRTNVALPTSRADATAP